MAHRPDTLQESYKHGQGVANILAEWRADEDLQAAGLLHSLVCRRSLAVEAIEAACNPQVARLCRDYCGILRLVPEQRWHGRTLVFKRIKLYIAAYRDPALAFLGAASLWEHFLTVQHSSDPALQRAFVDEAEQVMIPLYEMLGMWRLKTRVQRWVALRHISEQDRDRLQKRLQLTEDTRRQAFDLVRQRLQPQLPSADIGFASPSLAQIYNPDHTEKVNHEILNRLTVNVCVEDEPACYEALRWVNRFWQPVEYKLVDHVGTSKLNGYRCLETTVIVPLGSNHVRAHVNIYTRDMAEVNRWGLAAILLRHRRPADLPNAWWHNREEGVSQIASAALGTLPDVLYVFSPQGQLFRFPRSSTVVDFAYHLHSELAHQTRRFTLNGEHVVPATPLHHLDLVELERDPQSPGPTPTWLHAAFTSRARKDIERFLKKQHQGERDGRAVIEAETRSLSNHYRLHIPRRKVEQALVEYTRRLDLERPEQLLARVADGRVQASVILHPLFSTEVARQIEAPPHIRLRARQYALAQCCKPRPGDEIVGRPRIVRAEVVRLKVHRAECHHIAGMPGAVPLQWRLQPRLDAVARLEISARADNSLLPEVLALLNPHFPEVTLHKVYGMAKNGAARLSLTLEAANHDRIEAVRHALLELPGQSISEVRLMQLTFTEHEELATADQPGSFNPYRRQPVRQQVMFFGRAEELAETRELLRTGAGVVFVQGQKRVGKTSLLLYLKNSYLNRQSKIPVFVDCQLLSHLSGPEFFYEIAHNVYHELESDKHLSATQIEPPLQELFEQDPSRQLIDYLRRLQGSFGYRKLILLLDEFSRTIDAFQQGRIDDTIFHQWRGIIHQTAPEISYVLVMQDQTYQNLVKQPDQAALDPIWHVLELGHSVRLKPLSQADARQLIEQPTSNHFAYTPQALGAVWRLTGGSPFLIHAFCFDLVRHVGQTGQRLVELADVEAVQLGFMGPSESIFAHLLDIIHTTPQGADVCHQLATLLGNTDGAAPLTELNTHLRHLSAETVVRTLTTLTDQHILERPQAGQWQFASLLFGRWLATNPVLL
ncbi:MAG: hypothetical protein Kow0031_15130 [Anaerolineae bacterium]